MAAVNNIYLIGSLRNPKIPVFANELRTLGYDVFDDWFAPGPETDDYWMKYEKARGRRYDQALRGYAARNVFNFDFEHLKRADAAVLLAPAGKSGHLELGYMIGKGKKGFILFEEEPERWDIMMNFATNVFFDKKDLFTALKA